MMSGVLYFVFLCFLCVYAPRFGYSPATAFLVGGGIPVALVVAMVYWDNYKERNRKRGE